MTKGKPRWLGEWGETRDPKYTSGRLDSSLIKNFWAERSKKLRYANTGIGNYITCRAAFGLLGMSRDDVYEDGMIELDPKKYADFGAMTSFIGPPQSALDAIRANVVPANVGPYPPDPFQELRDKSAEIKFHRERMDQFEVLGVDGAQAGIGYTMLSYINPDEEVIVTDPSYFHFEPAVNLAGGVVKRIPLGKHNNYRFDPEEIRKAITSRTKMIVVCDPLNPFGTVQTKEELIEICKICGENDVMIFNNITHGTHQIDPKVLHYPITSLHEECNVDHVISTCGTSKGYGMAAARVGFLAGHPDLLQSVTFVRMPIGKAHTNLLAQHGVLAAIQDFDYVKRSEEIMRRNLKHLAETVEMTEGCFIPVMPKYGFAITIDISGTNVTAQELCVALTKRKIALYPGDGLGDVGATTTLRLNFSRPDIEPFDLFRDALPEAIAESRTGIYAERIAKWYEKKGTPRGLRIAQEIREKRMK